MRFALIVGAFFSFASGVQLFVLTDHTEAFFAWTIASGASATILGAFYLTACTIALLSWHRQPWVRARVGILGVVVFLWATLLATALHLDQFHLTSGSNLGRAAAWIWLIVYIADPILVTAALIVQWRMPGEDPPRAAPSPSAYRRFLAVSAVFFGAAGAVMFLLPALAVRMTAWPLTPLTSRTIGAVALGTAGVFATMGWENDADRIRPAAIGFTVAAALLLVGVARYPGEFEWGGTGPLHLVVIGVLAIVGVAGRPWRKVASGRAPSRPRGP